MRLIPGQTVAFQMSQCLGDSLLAMIVVNNLARNGHRVVVFGDYIHALKDWFPAFEVHPTVKPVDLMQWLVRLVTPWMRSGAG